MDFNENNNINDKYNNGIKYVYDNIDKFMQNTSFKNYIDNSENILDRYHKIFNTDDRNEVIAKYIILTLYILENNIF